MTRQVKVLMVCLGNICRSPTAQGVFEAVVADAGLGHVIEVDSAGTSGWHIGEPPDRRSQAAALQRGYDLHAQRGRQVAQQDFKNFDYVLAMDHSNLLDLQRMSPADTDCHLELFLTYGSQREHDEVPDPYYGGATGFELVLDLIEDASHGLLRHIQKNHLDG